VLGIKEDNEIETSQINTRRNSLRKIADRNCCQRRYR